MRLIEVRVDTGFDQRHLSYLGEVVAKYAQGIDWRVAVGTTDSCVLTLSPRVANGLSRLETAVANWFNKQHPASISRSQARLNVANASRAPAEVTVIVQPAGSTAQFHDAGEGDVIVLTWPNASSTATVGLHEVRTKMPTTEFSVSVFSADGSLRTRFRVGVPTQFTFSWTHDLLLRKAMAVAGLCATRLLAGEPLPRLAHEPPSVAPAGTVDDIGTLVDYSMRMAGRCAVKATRYLSRQRQQWQLTLSRGTWREHVKDGGQPIPNPPGRFWADPFVISRQGRDIIFVEDFDLSRGLAHISALEIHPNGEISDLGTCLYDDVHLSFPYIFEWEGQLYMCPEISQRREIRVYRSVEFPLKWELASVLMKGVSAADTILTERDGRWWMLTNLDSSGGEDHCTELHVFWSDNPLSQHWTRHQHNPVIADARRARNGGLIHDADGLFRVGQIQSYGIYGAGYQVNRVHELSEQGYMEQVAEQYVPALTQRGEMGAHHLSTTGLWTVSDRLQFASTDG